VVFQPTPVRKPDGLWVVVVEAIRKELVDDALGLPSEYPLRSTRAGHDLVSERRTASVDAEGAGKAVPTDLESRHRGTEVSR